jgi:hypothetical protein
MQSRPMKRNAFKEPKMTNSAFAVCPAAVCGPGISPKDSWQRSCRVLRAFAFDSPSPA